eukprot:m.26092 g.26092  ORF g.26092 m.26092 type:complete len:75 (+) comp29117_c0_seq1:3-227(+)
MAFLRLFADPLPWLTAAASLYITLFAPCRHHSKRSGNSLIVTQNIGCTWITQTRMIGTSAEPFRAKLIPDRVTL